MLHDGQEAVLAIGEVLVLVGVEPIRNGMCFIFRDALVEFDVQVPDSRRPEQILDRWIFRGAKIILASVHLGVGSDNNTEEGIEMLAAQGAYLNFSSSSAGQRSTRLETAARES